MHCVRQVNYKMAGNIQRLRIAVCITQRGFPNPQMLTNVSIHGVRVIDYIAMFGMMCCPQFLSHTHTDRHVYICNTSLCIYTHTKYTKLMWPCCCTANIIIIYISTRQVGHIALCVHMNQLVYNHNHTHTFICIIIYIYNSILLLQLHKASFTQLQMQPKKEDKRTFLIVRKSDTKCISTQLMYPGVLHAHKWQKRLYLLLTTVNRSHHSDLWMVCRLSSNHARARCR